MRLSEIFGNINRKNNWDTEKFSADINSSISTSIEVVFSSQGVSFCFASLKFILLPNFCEKNSMKNESRLLIRISIYLRIFVLKFFVGRMWYVLRRNKSEVKVGNVANFGFSLVLRKSINLWDFKFNQCQGKICCNNLDENSRLIYVEKYDFKVFPFQVKSFSK